MIDRLKLVMPPEWIATRPDIALVTRVNRQTGEVYHDWEEGEIDGWQVLVHARGTTLLLGSPHKYHTGAHNGGEFGRHDVAASIRRLASSLQVEPERIGIQVMEFGVNVLMPGQPADLLQRALLHGTQQLNRNVYGGSGHLVEAVRTQYYLKLYDKGMQLVASGQVADYPGHVLRIEAKTRAMEWVKSAGVATLADLCNPAALARLGEILQRTFAEMLFACPMPLPDGLTKKDTALLERGARVPYWVDLKPGSRTATKTRYRKAQALVPDELLQAATVGLPAAWLQLLNQPEPGAAAAATVPALPLGLIRPSEPLSKGSNAGTHPHTPAPILLPAAAGEGWQVGRQDGWQARPLAVVQSDDDEGASERAEGSMQARTPSAGGLDGGGPQHAPAPMEVSPAQPGQRYCHTCGLPINVKSGRKFCSPKERGAQHAHRCRNADSNPRLAERRKVEAREARIGGTLPLFAA